MVLIKIRVPGGAVGAAKKAAEMLSETEGKPVTFTEVVRRQVMTGQKVMAFELDPTSKGAAVELLNSNATLAAAAAYKYFQEQNTNAA